MIYHREGVAARVVRLAISALYYAGESVWTLCLRLAGKPVPGRCVVLYYHSVEDRARFARQMEMAARLTHPISIENPPALSAGRRYSAITFDDGFQNVVENALPELVKRGIPAAVFVTTGLLGRLATWWPTSKPEHKQPLATEDELRLLAANGIGIGAHTVTHPWLTRVEETEARREIAEPATTLRNLLGSEVGTFSFPYGDFNPKAVAWCREAGYSRVFTSEHRYAFQHPGDFVNGRVKVEPSDWELEFRLKLLADTCGLRRPAR